MPLFSSYNMTVSTFVFSLFKTRDCFQDQSGDVDERYFSLNKQMQQHVECKQTCKIQLLQVKKMLIFKHMKKFQMFHTCCHITLFFSFFTVMCIQFFVEFLAEFSLNVPESICSNLLEQLQKLAYILNSQQIDVFTEVLHIHSLYIIMSSYRHSYTHCVCVCVYVCVQLSGQKYACSLS